jgi:glycosyl transferase family 87
MLAGLAVLYGVATDLLRAVFAGPLDSARGDMLVIIDHAIARMLGGGSPYAVHKVPWDAPLSYGPMLWLPYVIPYTLRFDFRIFTLIAQLTIPALCFAAAAQRFGQAEFWRGAVLFSLGAAVALDPSMRAFHQVGHTQVYWPVLAVFCVLLRRERWTAAAVCLGLLVSARTTMVSLVPVFFIYLYLRRALTTVTCAAFVVAAVLPLIPFLVIDARAVKDGMFDTYIRVMKAYVWRSTTWAIDTYGITGRLLERGSQRYVEAVQLLSLAIVYIMSWRALGRGRRVEPWLGCALLVFSMTTLWSVHYLYYDVWMLLVSALIAYDDSWRSFTPSGVAPLGAAVAVCAGVVFTAAAANPGSSYLIDVGAPGAAGYTGGGFGADIAEPDGGRLVVWVEGTTARIRVPRAAWTGAMIEVAVKPNSPYPGARQSVLISLNGHTLGTAPLKDGWQDVACRARRSDWIYGFNLLELSFSYAAPRPDAQVHTVPPKQYAAAIDFLKIE